MTWLLILAFAVSSSIDNLGVGISYGIRDIHIGHLKNVFVAVICFLFSIVGILFGQWISLILPGTLPIVLGAFFLFIIGIRIILLAVPRHKRQPKENSSTPKRDKSLKGILNNPETVDFDQSGEISYVEAFVLGIALSANALTNGLGAGLFGLSPLWIALTASIGSYLTIWWGVALGKKVATVRIGSFTVGQFGTIISGMLLLIIAIGVFL